MIIQILIIIKIESKKDSAKKDDIQLVITSSRSSKLHIILSSKKVKDVINVNYESTYSHAHNTLSIKTKEIEYGVTTGNNKYIKLNDIQKIVKTYLGLRENMNKRMQNFLQNIYR